MGVFDNIRNTFRRTQTVDDVRVALDEYTGSTLLSAWLSGEGISREQAIEIPAVSSALNLIKNTVRIIPVKLYKREADGGVSEVDDKRVYLLNNDTGDTLTSGEMWDAVIEDYYIDGSAFVYINKRRNKIKSINYVDRKEISILSNLEPIFKDYYINVRGIRYQPFDFFKIVRNTKDGANGKGILDEQPLLLNTMFNSIRFENNLVATGGNKKGFLKSNKKLTKDSIDQLKASWRKLYSSNTENVVVLNDGLEFQESSNNAVEMQLATQKELNDAEVARIFTVPVGMLTGATTSEKSAEDKQKFLDYCIYPLLETIENSLNRDLLLESEKEHYFFKFDTKDVQKGSLLERMQAYEIAKRNNFMMLDEIRKYENLPVTGIKYMDMGLSSVLYDPDTDMIMVPNTGSVFKLGELKQGVETDDTDTNQGQ